MSNTPECLCHVLAGPEADVTNDNKDATELPAGTEADSISMATAAGAWLCSANNCNIQSGPKVFYNGW